MMPKPRKPTPGPKKPRYVKQKGDYTHIIDLDQVEALCAIQCTDEELAAVLGVSRPTIERRKKDEQFLRAYQDGKAKGKTSLRRYLWKSAEGGNTQAQIWLSKQHLEMRDVQAMQLSGPNDGPIEHRDTGMDLKKLSLDELKTLRALKEKAEREKV
jgi:hypothetical protein